ncbi:MAG TPA: hypothetical protein VFE39_11540, partial [Pseudonocardia sp.]|nr:hypothetical protein [Pseudonocardia sp.]
PSQAYCPAVGAGSTAPELREVERWWAQAHVHVQYLGFAADHLGPARVAEMIETAASAMDRLGPALKSTTTR